MSNILIEAGIIAGNILVGSVVGVVSNKITKKNFVKKAEAGTYDTEEAKEKAIRKAKRNAAIVSTAITSATAVGISAASACVISSLENSTDETSSDSDDTTTSEES